MTGEKFTLMQYSVSAILGLIDAEDFVMSKMAADTIHVGSLMRKTVDYFCHLAVKADFYSQLTHDTEFQASKYADKIKWLAKDHDDIYDPDYGDMLRVSFMHQFRRGKLADLVSLLSGRDFVMKEFREAVVTGCEAFLAYLREKGLE